MKIFKNAIKRCVMKPFNNPDIKAFLAEHQNEITQEMIDKSMSKLYEYTNQSKELQPLSKP